MIRRVTTVGLTSLALLAGTATAALAGPDGPDHWVVESGDTLSHIGQQTDHAWQDLCAWNRDQISDCNRIHPGWRLRLFPAEGAAATPAPSGQGNYTGRTPVETWERLAQCESGGNWSINTGNGYYGGIQISKQTWDGHGGREFAAYAHQTVKWNQMTVGQRILDNQGWGAWPYCSREIGMR